MLNKNINFEGLRLLTAAVFIVVFFLSFFSFSPQISAVEPGCYNSNFVKLPPTQCPSEGASRAVSQYGACYVGSEERDCDDLTQSGNAVPEPRTFSSDPIETDCEPENNEPLSRRNCGIINMLVIGINFLSALAGLAIVFSLMFAGYQYMTARDNSGQIQKSKHRIVMTIVALALFISMYALLDFFVPGGVL